MRDRGPYSESEDQGTPDLEDDYPERLWMEDPQWEALPGDEPAAIDDYGTTAEEYRTGEPMADRLRREQPEPSIDDRPYDEDMPYDPAQEPPRRAGRLVEPDEGVRADTESDAIAEDAGPDAGVFTAEEQAMHVVDEEE